MVFFQDAAAFSICDNCGLLVAPLDPRYKKTQGKLRLLKSVPCCHEYYAGHGIFDSKNQTDN
jgi:hypothetical protein